MLFKGDICQNNIGGQRGREDDHQLAEVSKVIPKVREMKKEEVPPVERA